MSENEYKIGDTVKYLGGKVGKVISQCGDGYHVDFIDGPQNKHVDAKDIEKVVMPKGYKNIKGVNFNEAEPVLVLEKYGILGRAKIDLKSFPGAANTDGKTIFLPEIFDLFPYQRKEDEDIGNDPNLTIYIGMLFHEASHIRYGSFLVDFLGYLRRKFSNLDFAREILNIIEDARVEYQFKNEFIDDPKKVMPLVQTMRYLVKIMKNPEEENIINALLMLLNQKCCSDYTHGELTGDVKTEKKILEKKYKTLSGKEISLLEVFSQARKLIDEVKGPDKTIFDSLEQTKQVYKLFEEVFGKEEMPKIKPLPQMQSTPHGFDQGDIQVVNEKDLNSPEIKKEFEKQYKKQRQEMDINKKDIEEEIQRMKEEGRLPENYEPPKIDEYTNKPNPLQGLIDNIKDSFSKDRKKGGSKKEKGGESKTNDNASKPSGQSGSSENGNDYNSNSANVDPLKIYVKEKLEERGYSKDRAKEISENLDPKE